MRYLQVWILLGLFVAFGSFVVIMVRVLRRRDSKRRDELASVAASLGLNYAAIDNSPFGEVGTLLPQGSQPYTTSVMRGQIDTTPILLFDYHMQIGGGDSRMLVQRTYAAFDMSQAPLPAFFAESRPQKGFGRFVDNTFAEKNSIVDFPDDPNFTDTFRVTASNTDAVRRALGPHARAYFMQRKTWTIRSNGRWLLLAWSDNWPAVTEYTTFVNQAIAGMRALITLQ